MWQSFQSIVIKVQIKQSMGSIFTAYQWDFCYLSGTYLFQSFSFSKCLDLKHKLEISGFSLLKLFEVIVLKRLSIQSLSTFVNLNIEKLIITIIITIVFIIVIIIIIIVTRPWPAFSRQGLDRSSGQYSFDW